MALCNKKKCDQHSQKEKQCCDLRAYSKLRFTSTISNALTLSIPRFCIFAAYAKRRSAKWLIASARPCSFYFIRRRRARKRTCRRIRLSAPGIWRCACTPRKSTRGARICKAAASKSSAKNNGSAAAIRFIFAILTTTVSNWPRRMCGRIHRRRQKQPPNKTFAVISQNAYFRP